jgi:hypothetical protein
MERLSRFDIAEHAGLAMVVVKNTIHTICSFCAPTNDANDTGTSSPTQTNAYSANSAATDGTRSGILRR